MFATLLGPLPRPPLEPDATPEALLMAVVRAQEAAGLEPLTDGGFGIGESAVERWRTTAALTNRPVKQVLIGPYSTAQADWTTGRGQADARVLADLAQRAAEVLNADLRDLTTAGCPIIEIHEPSAIGIGTDDGDRTRFRDAHHRLLDGVSGSHLSLAITGGSADAVGAETLLAGPYASLAVDLIAGPDNWRLVAATPGERGIVCGAMSVERNSDDRLETLLWAAGYASSTQRRGAGRVGLATASSLAGLPWEVALRKLAILGEAARLADLPPEERRHHLDPRALDSRSAALGRVEPRPAPRRG